MATDIVFGVPADIPTEPDETPEWISGHAPFDPQYPDSTPEAPYGFKKDGTPYTRHHGKRSQSSGGSVRKMPANPAMAKSAAGLLARLNLLFGLAIHTSGLEATAMELRKANEQFEELAYEALSADPVLCKKILGAGATGGKTGLIVAYSMLGVAIVPTARTEIIERRRARESENGND